MNKGGELMNTRKAAQSLQDNSEVVSTPGPQSNDTIPTEEGPSNETVERKSWTTERAGQSLVDQGIGIMVAVIVIGAVAIPVVQDVVNSINTTEMGMAGNILEYVTLALALGLFVAAISIVR